MAKKDITFIDATAVRGDTETNCKIRMSGDVDTLMKMLGIIIIDMANKAHMEPAAMASTCVTKGQQGLREAVSTVC